MMKRVKAYLLEFNNRNTIMTRDVCISCFCLFFVWFLISGIVEYNKHWNENKRIGNFLAIEGGDTDSYLKSTENYIQTGKYYLYTPDEDFVGRGPYYGVPYFLFRQVLDQKSAFDAYALLQILLFSLAVVLVLKMVDDNIKNKLLLVLIPIILLFVPVHYNMYNIRLISESLTLSWMLVFIYFYYRYNKNNNVVNLWLAALFLALASVIKPYFLIIYALCFFDYLWNIKNNISIQKCLRYVCIMSIPLIIICTPFTIRNYMKWGIFAPMQNTGWFGRKIPPAYLSVSNFIKITGKNDISWDSTALGTFFYPEKDCKYAGELPGDIITPDYSENDLYCLRYDLQEYLKTDDELLGYSVEERAKKYTASYIKYHPLSPITSRLQYMWMLVKHDDYKVNYRHNGIRFYISNILSLWHVCKYYIYLLLGVVSICLIIKYINIKFVLWIGVFILLYFSYIRAGEHRFYLLVEYLYLISIPIFIDYLICCKKDCN